MLGRHLSSSTTDCHKDGLRIAQFRILLQFRISFSGFYEILKLPCSSLESRRSITNHILALAH